MRDKSYTKAVQQGITFLRGLKQDLRLIDLETFDISADQHCPLGQLFGSYMQYLENNPNLTREILEPLGFLLLPVKGYDAAYAAQLAALNQAWREALTALRQPATVARLPTRVAETV